MYSFKEKVTESAKRLIGLKKSAASAPTLFGLSQQVTLTYYFHQLDASLIKNLQWP